MKQYWSNIFSSIYTMLLGMKVTFKHLFKKPVTLKYPYEKDPNIPEISRMKLEVDYDDCIGCKQCERACPVQCIHITTTRALPEDDLAPTSNGTARKLLTTSFVIDFSECMYCNLCTYPCPENCIVMTPNYEFGKYDKGELITYFSPLSQEEQEKRLKLADDMAAAAAAAKAKAAAEKENSSPAAGKEL